MILAALETISLHPRSHNSTDPLVHETTTKSTTSVLNLWTGQAPYLPRGFHRPWDENNWLLRYSNFGQDKLPISQEDSIVHETTIIDYYGTRTSDGTNSLSPRKNYSSRRWPHIDYYGTRPHEDTKPSTIYKKYSSRRWQPVDYHSTWLKLRQGLKKSYSSTRWKAKEETRSLPLHKMIAQNKVLTQQLIDQKVIFTWQKEDTVHPTGLSTLQFGRP